MHHHYFDLKDLKIKILKSTLCIGLAIQACVQNKQEQKKLHKIKNGINI
jgi:hypothetical protein